MTKKLTKLGLTCLSNYRSINCTVFKGIKRVDTALPEKLLKRTSGAIDRMRAIQDTPILLKLSKLDIDGIGSFDEHFAEVSISDTVLVNQSVERFKQALICFQMGASLKYR